MSSTVQKALNILDLFLSEESSQLGVTEIGKFLKMNKSTISRLVSSLEKNQMIVLVPETRKYELGPKILQLSNRIYQQKNVSQVAQEYMNLIRDETSETVSLQIKMGTKRVCIQRVQGLHEICRTVEVGNYLPLHAGSSGKLLLAYETEAHIDKYLKTSKLEVFTSYTITDLELFKETLKVIRNQGYAMDMNERIMGLSGESAPIFNYEGRVIAVLSVSGPANRWDMKKMKDYTERLVEIAQIISGKLGYQHS